MAVIRPGCLSEASGRRLVSREAAVQRDVARAVRAVAPVEDSVSSERLESCAQLRRQFARSDSCVAALEQPPERHREFFPGWRRIDDRFGRCHVRHLKHRRAEGRAGRGGHRRGGGGGGTRQRTNPGGGGGTSGAPGAGGGRGGRENGAGGGASANGGPAGGATQKASRPGAGNPGPASDKTDFRSL